MKREHDDFEPLPLKINREEDVTPNGQASQRDRRYVIVEYYSSRYLTKETDKLPALAHLASKFHDEQNPGEYCAGIWSNHLPSSLLWKTAPNYSNSRRKPMHPLAAFLPRRPQEQRAPSWSWASIDGEITYESQRIQGGNTPTNVFDAGFGEFEITGLIFQSASKFEPLRAPPDAFLQIGGLIAEVEVNMQQIENDSTNMRRLIGEDGRTVGALYPDIIDDFRAVKSVFVLSIRSEPHDSAVEIPSTLYPAPHINHADWVKLGRRMGLALLPARSAGTYRRVGLVRSMRKEIFRGPQPIELKLI